MATQFLDTNVVKSNKANVDAFTAWLAAHADAYDIPEGQLADPDLVEDEENAWSTWLLLTQREGLVSPGHQLGLLTD